MNRLLLLFSLLFAAPAFGDEIRTVGATSQCFAVFIADSSVTTGAGKTGLAYNTPSLVCYYFRNETGTGETATQITMASSTLGTFTSGALKEISSGNMPGWYEFCPPDTALATGALSVALQCQGAANMAPMNLRVLLFGTADVNVVSIANDVITSAAVATSAATEIGASATGTKGQN